MALRVLCDAFLRDSLAFLPSLEEESSAIPVSASALGAVERPSRSSSGVKGERGQKDAQPPCDSATSAA